MNPNNRKHRPIVSVYGSSLTEPGDPSYAAAVRIGTQLARYGASVACGGYGGIMEAVSRGAVEGGGVAVGYTVAGWKMRTPNAYLSDERICRDLYDRLQRLIEDSHALVAVSGGIGTLVEVALAWNLFYMRLIEPRPLVLVGASWKRAVEDLRVVLEISDAHMEHVVMCPDVDAAVEHLKDRGVIS